MRLSKSTPDDDSQGQTQRTYRVKRGHQKYDLALDATTFRLLGGERVSDDNLDRMQHTNSGPTRFEAILRFMFFERRFSSNFPQLLWVAPDKSLYFTTAARSTEEGETPKMLYVFEPAKSTPRRVELVDPIPGEILPSQATPPESRSTSSESLQPIWPSGQAPRAMRQVHAELTSSTSSNTTRPRLSLAAIDSKEPTAWLRHGNKLVFVPPEGSIVTTRVDVLTQNWATAADCGLFKPDFLRGYRALLDARPQAYEDTPVSRWTDAAIPLLIELVALNRWRDAMQVHPSFLLTEHHRRTHVCIGSGDRSQ